MFPIVDLIGSLVYVGRWLRNLSITLEDIDMSDVGVFGPNECSQPGLTHSLCAVAWTPPYDTGVMFPFPPD